MAVKFGMQKSQDQLISIFNLIRLQMNEDMHLSDRQTFSSFSLCVCNTCTATLRQSVVCVWVILAVVFFVYAVAVVAMGTIETSKHRNVNCVMTARLLTAVLAAATATVVLMMSGRIFSVSDGSRSMGHTVQFW